MPIRLFVDSLARAGYAGPVGLKYAPGGPTVSTLAFLAEA